MLRTPRIGVRIGSADPFWVQTQEAVLQRSQQVGIELVPIDVRSVTALSAEQQLALLEELLAQELDALICTYLPEELTCRLLEHGLPVVQLTETQLRHPLLVSPCGYYEIAQMVGAYLAERLAGRGTVLVVGGLTAPRGEDGRSRLAGIAAALSAYPEMRLHHIPSAWRYTHAYPQILTALRQYQPPIDAIYGLSDSLALAARDAGRELGLLTGETLIVGSNGDPLALAAIADGSMAATVDTPATELALQAVELACQAARRAPLPGHFGYAPRLVTAANVAEVALQKLTAIAELPSRLVGINRQQEQQRLDQLELSLEINRRVGSLLNREQLSHEIAELIRAGYGYDTVQLYLWLEQEQALVLDQSAGARTPLAAAGLLGEALQRNELLFVPDTQHSQRFPPDPRWPSTRSRVVVPVRFGGSILGLLDLHSRRTMQHSRQSLAGLQLLADQLGIAMRNAELYSDALRALRMAEQADQLKTRLLANVSHELRTPLNVILGYSQAALATPNPYATALPPALLHDLRHIYRSGEHLIRLINDLLDLSRAEIGALELFPEPIATRPFLVEVFESIADGLPRPGQVRYELVLPERLPMIQADPLRLRQVLLNLLSNARKFTTRGQITLGAEVAPPHLHIWVADSGAGIPAKLQERIFEPFVSSAPGDGRAEGVGLGLSITRRLVALHRGTLSVDSQPGLGSTFHLYLPLPGLAGAASALPAPPDRTLLLVGAAETPAAIAELSRRQELEILRLRPGDNLRRLLDQCQPVALAWDLARSDLLEWAVVQQLRADPRVCQLPLILYPPEDGRVLQPGATGVLSKPLQSQTLLDAIEALRPAGSAGPVLVVDDDPQARALYGELVARALPGLPIRIAEGGAAALSLLEQELPSLVLLDLAMPDVDGFAVLQQLRAAERTRQVPVLILSGRTLALEDVKRLDHALVTFQSKELLSCDETVAALRAALGREGLLPQHTSRLVKAALAYLQQHYARDLSRQEIAQAVGVSKNYLTQIFQQELGLSPWDYLNRYRIKQAKALLRGTSASITSVASQVGFNDISYFGRVFRRQVGCSPQAYRQQP